MTRNELMVDGEYEILRSQIATLENADDFSNWKSQIVMSDEDCGIAICDTFRTASMRFSERLWKRGFVFSKMDSECTMIDAERKECTKR